MSRSAKENSLPSLISPVRDADGCRLAKRTGGLAIRDLRARGCSPTEVLSASLRTFSIAASVHISLMSIDREDVMR